MADFTGALRSMKRFTALPTFLYTLFLLRFMPTTHPWKRRPFTLDQWARGRTDFTVGLDIALWMALILVINLLLR